MYEYVLSCGVTCPTDYHLHSIKPYQSNLFADYPIGCQADCENPLSPTDYRDPEFIYVICYPRQ